MCVTSDDCDGKSDEELESSEACILYKFSMLILVLCIFFHNATHANRFLP